MEYFVPEIVSLKDEGFDEKWMEDRIAEDPSILGLGDELSLVERQRRQGSKVLDLFFEDKEKDFESFRYAVEIQLGYLDEDHLMRAIEYWDREQKKLPECTHICVLVAEDVTSRFIDFVQHFNKKVKLILLELEVIRHDGRIGLFCVQVFNSAW